MCTKLCRKKGFDALVIMNVFRESTKRGGKKASWQGDCLWDRDGPWARGGRSQPRNYPPQQAVYEWT